MDPTDQSLEDVNRNLFTSNIRNTVNPPNFKLPTLEMYDGKSNLTIHLMRHIRHMEVFGACNEVMGRCFLLYLTDLAAMWFRRLENRSISTWIDLVSKF